MCKQTADIKIELVLLCDSAWSYLIVCKEMDSGLFGLLSTKYSFKNLRFNMCINGSWH